jgi:SWI/SNF chromatin-remodeling complex subunit SWI1
MQQSQMAMKQRNTKQGVRPPPSATAGSQAAPSPAATGAPTPIMAPSPASVSAPTPKPVVPTSQVDLPSTAGPPQQAPPPPVAGPSDINRPASTKPVPPPIMIEPSAVPIVATTSTTGATPTQTTKRKYTKRKSGAGSAETSRPATPAATPGETPIERPPTPKRKRYKVEYKPLHLPNTHLAGWDERMVSSTFPKNNIGHPARSIHELESVDMEAIIMGIRSRIPRELGYGLTVLSMLSMGVPEENIHGLPLAPVPELYHELLELLSDATFGEDGYTAWSASAPKKCQLNDISFGELEQLGRDMDFGLDEKRDSTGGQTDVVLSCLNLLRNFSILPENWQLMSRYPEVFETLARVTDGRLCRLPYDLGSSTTHKPYSLYELARVRRDVVTILANLGASIDLGQASPSSVEQIIKVISSFLVSGFTMQSDSLYGPAASQPPTPLHSVNRAVEAFCKLSWSDSNREILSKLPSDLHVTLFESMIKLLPVQTRQFDHLRTSEDYLGQTECLALSLYSLAFTAPLSTRSTLRHIPGAVQVITRLVHNLSQHGTEYRVNPYGVLVRRLAEVLGILNGTSGLGLQADPVGMSFSAVLGDEGKSKSGNRVVEKGWLAFDQERITNSMTTRGLEGPAFVELDNLWWGGE